MDALGDGFSLALAAILVGSLAAALGLVVGLWWAPARLAAAVGVVCYFVGALVFHARARDPQVGPPVFLCLAAAAVLAAELA